MQIPVATMTRQQLYDEIWKISAAGVAKKYGISYPLLLRQIKDAYITSVSYGRHKELYKQFIALYPTYASPQLRRLASLKLEYRDI